ncbi:MAG: UDP-2,3-diacylglucosamine diphosphatase [Fimbriimonadaceae bacterium]
MPGRRLQYRAVFVSDVHLGSAGSMVEEFKTFLDAVDCEYLYLVGDIVDLWVAVKASKWRDIHTDVVQALLEKSKQGTKIYFTPGNHDAFLRRLNGSQFGNIEIGHTFVHETTDGLRLQVVHGDLFDKSVKYVPVAWLAAWAYESVTVFNGWVNGRRVARGKEPMDFSSVFKKRLKKYFSRKNDFEGTLLAQAMANGYDGVVCGHIHRPTLQMDEEGGWYMNAGDWVEHGTAIVESSTGRLELLTWREIERLLAEGEGGPSATIPREPEHRETWIRSTSSL